MNIQKIINGKTLQLISSKNNIINKSKSETKHKDLNNKRYINYKLLLQEKDNEIHKLKNEIDYYKDCINIKTKKKKFEGFNNKPKKKLNISKINNLFKFRNFLTIEQVNNENNIFKQRFNSIQVKKIKLMQKKNINYNEQNNEIKNNNDLHKEKLSFSNSITDNQSNLINFSANSIICNNNENHNIQKLKMENIQNRMDNLLNNLFAILQNDKKSKK